MQSWLHIPPAPCASRYRRISSSGDATTYPPPKVVCSAARSAGLTFQFSAKTLTKAGRDTSARAARKLSARGVPPRQGVEDRDLPATDFEQVGCLEVAPDLLTKVGENRLYVVGALCVDRAARPAA